MTRSSKNRIQKRVQNNNHNNARNPVVPTIVPSLLDVMVDGTEYESIVGKQFEGNLIPELRRGLSEIERIRGRPCICYLSNMINPLVTNTGIDLPDALPFAEMIQKVQSTAKSVDVFLVTPGGIANVVEQFVQRLRSRFDLVEFILPDRAMSAGTLFALSGDDVWMDSRAVIGPIDPQIRTRDGQMVAMQSVLILLNNIRAQGDDALKNKQPVPWHLVRLLDNMDHSKIGEAMNASQYSINMAKRFLEEYKFRLWNTHSTSGKPVTSDEKATRAHEIASLLCQSSRWGSHGHGISREVAEKELRLKIKHLESVGGLERAVRRFWALMNYSFDKALISKMFLSSDYCIVKNTQLRQQKPDKV